MVDVVFNTFWRELKDWYGKETKYSFDEQTEKLFANVPSNSAEDVLKYITYNYDFFPKFTELRAIAAKFEVIKQEPVNNDKCLYCLGSGLIKYSRKVKNLTYNPEYFAACVCSYGKRYRNNPIKGIEDVYGPRTEEVLKTLAERNAPNRTVPELQADIERSLDIMSMRNQRFKKEA